MILTEGPKMTLTPTYHAFEMYIPFQGATYLPTEVSTPSYQLGDVTVSAVSVTAARDKSGAMQYALVNLDPGREAVVTTSVTGARVGAAIGRVLTATRMDAHNTVDAPDAVHPTPVQATRKGDSVVLRLPAKSVSVVRIE
jgi:alpha-N-arabinofuranosidase